MVKSLIKMRNFCTKSVVVFGIHLFLNCAAGPPNFKMMSANPTDRLDKNRKVDPYFRQNFPYWVDGMDKEGRPVYTNTIGEWDFQGKVSSKGRSEEFRAYLVSIFEENKLAIKKSSELHPDHPPVTQIIAIYNWEGFDMNQFNNYQAIQDFLMIAKIYEKKYNDILYALFFINCDETISKVITLLSPILSPGSKKKLRVHKAKKEVWQTDILQYIDADQIRPQFGGTKDNDKNPFADNSTKS